MSQSTGGGRLGTDIAVTVVGPDRPGIVADVAAALAGLRLNLTDSTMTLLRGHFAMMLVCSPAEDPAAAGDPAAAETGPKAEDVAAALAPLAASGRLIATARPLADELSPEPSPANPLVATPTEGGPDPYTLVVHGADRLGIVAAMTAVLANAGGNITDLATRLANGLYLLTLEVDLPADVDVADVAGQLAAEGARLGVTVTLSAVEADLL